MKFTLLNIISLLIFIFVSLPLSISDFSSISSNIFSPAAIPCCNLALILARPLAGPRIINIANIKDTNDPTVIVSSIKSKVDSKIIPDSDDPTINIMTALFIPSVNASFI